MKDYQGCHIKFNCFGANWSFSYLCVSTKTNEIISFILG